MIMVKHSSPPAPAVGFRSVLVAIPGAEPVRVEVTATHYASLSRQATRERTTVADLLRPTALAVLADRLAHSTETMMTPTPDDRDLPATS